MTTTTTTSWVRLLAVAGIAGPALFVIAIATGGLLDDEYSHLNQAISELGGAGAANPAVQNTAFIVLGLCVIGFAWALSRAIDPPHVAPALLAVFGLSAAILQAVFPCDPGCRGATTSGLLHNTTGMTGFVAAIVAMFLLARRWRDDATWGRHALYTRISGYVALGGLIAFVITQAAQIDSIDGLVQRIFAVTLLLWVALTSAELLRITTPQPTPTAVRRDSRL